MVTIIKQKNFAGFLFLIISIQSALLAERVAYFYALDQDLNAFERLAGPPVTSQTVGQTTIHSYIVGKHRVYAAKMGSGCVQTAITAQALLTLNRCDVVISSGPAGALDDQFAVGDWVVAGRAVPYQKGSYDFSGFSLAPDEAMSVGDPKLIDQLPERIPTAAIASGEVFVASDAYRVELSTLSDCSLVEMNLFGLAKTMQSHGLSGIHLRVVSDFADANASRDFRSFADGYDGEGGTIVHEWVRGLPSSGASPIEYENLRRLLE